MRYAASQKRVEATSFSPALPQHQYYGNRFYMLGSEVEWEGNTVSQVRSVCRATKAKGVKGEED